MSEYKTIEELKNIAIEEQKKIEGKELKNPDRMKIQIGRAHV